MESKMLEPILDIRNISKQFKFKRQVLTAVEDFSLSLFRKEVIGLGGESGCGKSTVGKLLMGLMVPSTGSILFNGLNLKDLINRRSQSWRKDIQMIFQHPASSLNPRLTIKEILSEPYIIHNIAKGQTLTKKVVELLIQVGLSEVHLHRYPHEISGGQKQRVAIARAMALEPQILICDEPFSALDVSIQSQIIHLLVQLHLERGLSSVIISHDLSVLRYLTQRMAIMYLGRIVELGMSQDVYDHPLHPYSQALTSAVLSIDPTQKRLKGATQIKGEVPSLLTPPKGCPFASRCPFAQKECHSVKPKWIEVKPRHFTACHLYQK